MKELGRSKWSNELDEDDTEQTEPIRGNLNALSGLIQAYCKEAKSVRWGDKVCIIIFVLLFGNINSYTCVCSQSKYLHIQNTCCLLEILNDFTKIFIPNCLEKQNELSKF